MTTQYHRKLETGHAPAPSSPFSLGVDTGSLVFVSGQLGINIETGKVPENVRDEARLVMEYLQSILSEAGLGMDDVAKTTVYVTDFSDYRAINEVYAEYFQASYPARATVKVAELLEGARVEIEAIAVRRRE